MKKTIVLYHGRCPDGFGAAFAAWLVLGDEAQYIPCSYGDEPPDVTAKRVFILDFSFEHDVMLRLESQAAELRLLDHHKTAQTKLHFFKCRCGGVHFDLGRSGAQLAWDYFHPGKAVPDLISHIQDRDLWKWEIPGSADYLAALDAEGFDYQAWLRLIQMTSSQKEQFVERGRAMNDKFKSLCSAIEDTAFEVQLQGVDGLLVNAPAEFSSDVGNMLATRSRTFGMVVQIQSPKTLKVSLRSNAPFDVEAMALKMGGGGHPQASSFLLPMELLPELLAGKL